MELLGDGETVVSNVPRSAQQSQGFWQPHHQCCSHSMCLVRTGGHPADSHAELYARIASRTATAAWVSANTTRTRTPANISAASICASTSDGGAPVKSAAAGASVSTSDEGASVKTAAAAVSVSTSDRGRDVKTVRLREVL